MEDQGDDYSVAVIRTAGDRSIDLKICFIEDVDELQSRDNFTVTTLPLMEIATSVCIA